MDVSFSTIIFLTGAAFCAGLVDAIAGGGGLISVPALLAAGLAPSHALGTNKGQSVFGSGIALFRFAKAKLVNKQSAMVSFPAGFVGALAGGGLLLLIPSKALRPVVMVLLVAVAVFLVVRPATPTSSQVTARPRSRSRLVAMLIALIIGAYDGFFGPGTGTFLIIAYAWFFDSQLREASADAKVVNFASNLASVMLFASRGLIIWPVALSMAVGQGLGGYIGAHFAIRGTDKVVRMAVLVVVVTLVGKLGVDLVWH